MTKQEIIEGLKQLPLFERLSAIEIATRIVREELKVRMLQTDINSFVARWNKRKLEPEDVDYIRIAAKPGLGEMDPGKVAVREV